MKHSSVKHMILDTETFLKYFMKSQMISYDQYVRDMDTFETDGKRLLDMLQDRVINGIDVLPYTYALAKVQQKDPRLMNRFIRYFLTMMSKSSNGDCDRDLDTHAECTNMNLEDVIRRYCRNVDVLYLIAAIQYYFL